MRRTPRFALLALIAGTGLGLDAVPAMAQGRARSQTCQEFQNAAAAVARATRAGESSLLGRNREPRRLFADGAAPFVTRQADGTIEYQAILGSDAAGGRGGRAASAFDTRRRALIACFPQARERTDLTASGGELYAYDLPGPLDATITFELTQPQRGMGAVASIRVQSPAADVDALTPPESGLGHRFPNDHSPNDGAAPPIVADDEPACREIRAAGAATAQGPAALTVTGRPGAAPKRFLSIGTPQWSGPVASEGGYRERFDAGGTAYVVDLGGGGNAFGGADLALDAFERVKATIERCFPQSRPRPGPINAALEEAWTYPTQSAIGADLILQRSGGGTASGATSATLEFRSPDRR